MGRGERCLELASCACRLGRSCEAYIGVRCRSDKLACWLVRPQEGPEVVASPCRINTLNLQQSWPSWHLCCMLAFTGLVLQPQSAGPRRWSRLASMWIPCQEGYALGHWNHPEICSFSPEVEGLFQPWVIWLQEYHNLTRHYRKHWWNFCTVHRRNRYRDPILVLCFTTLGFPPLPNSYHHQFGYYPANDSRLHDRYLQDPQTRSDKHAMICYDHFRCCFVSGTWRRFPVAT